MNIPQKDYVEQEQIGDFKEITSTISEKNLSLVLDNVTKNLYSDPIGAFVRELTSNGVDANKRNFKSEKVKVRIYKEGDSIYFEVKDEGIGMTPHVFEKVYMSWFESDKRNDNGQIGGWGIGSKSPLAYTESYELTTIANGVQYDYEIVRQAPAPVASLISSFETNKKSGTIVRVEVKEEDSWKLHLATIRQLVYFDNVIVTNELNYYDNHFKIIDHSLFMVRSDTRYPFGKEMHIVIGQVAYPIDWHILGIKPIYVPVGVKFDIGTIPVNLDREKIHYADDTVKLAIIQKVAEVKEILKTLYIARLDTTTLASYLEAINNPKNTINLGGYEIPFGIEMKNSKYTFNYKGESFSFSKDVIYELMSAFQIINLSKKDGKNIEHHSLRDIINRPYAFTYSKSKELTHWRSLYHKERCVIRRIPITIQTVRKYAQVLGLTVEGTGGISNGGYRFKTRLQTGAVKKVFLFIKAIEEVFETIIRDYDEVPEQFIKDEKAKQEALKEERKGNITYYDENGKKTVATLKSLIEDYQYVFYVSRDAPYEEQAAYMALYNSFTKNYNSFPLVTRNRARKNPRILVAIISASVIAKLKNKTKDLTIKQRVKVNGKKEWVSTTKNVYAFLSADKMFKFTELYSQFHRLRYSTLLHANLFDQYQIDKVSPYYAKLAKKIRITPVYSIKHKDYSDEYIYPYYYFRDQIDAITKNRNYEEEVAFEELVSVAVPLYIIGQAISDRTANNSNKSIVIREVIKKYKITKLKSIYYGY